MAMVTSATIRAAGVNDVGRILAEYRQAICELPLEESFAQTKAFSWLERHEGSFGFTLSFPKDNRHGFIYEPWHWCWRAR